ncbi:MAG: LacI family transcriptional regulator [Arenicella sp.]|jgi:LacI family transcriptional regulator
MSKVSLSNISKILGMSKSTVSKALNNYADVSPETRKKVLDLAEELNYKPNVFAQNLRSQESKIIGLIIPEIVHYFFSTIISGVVETAENFGYSVIVVQSNDDYKDEVKQLKLLLDKNVDGILLSLADNTIHFSHIKDIIKEGIPFVLYDKISKLIDCNKVVIDDVKAAQMATQHLIDIGCKKIAIIRNHLKSQTTIDRHKGYKKALLENGMLYDKLIDFEGYDVSFNAGKMAADIICENHKEIDGVFAVTDLLAIGALGSFREHGIAVPDQVSVIGFSNWFLSQITTPHLSTVDQPGFQIGKTSFNLLYQEIQNKKKNITVPSQTIVIPTTVISRESTK